MKCKGCLNLISGKAGLVPDDANAQINKICRYPTYGACAQNNPEDIIHSVQRTKRAICYNGGVAVRAFEDCRWCPQSTECAAENGGNPIVGTITAEPERDANRVMLLRAATMGLVISGYQRYLITNPMGKANDFVTKKSHYIPFAMVALDEYERLKTLSVLDVNESMHSIAKAISESTAMFAPNGVFDAFSLGSVDFGLSGSTVYFVYYDFDNCSYQDMDREVRCIHAKYSPVMQYRDLNAHNKDLTKALGEMVL